jgi:hypothetical protein
MSVRRLAVLCEALCGSLRSIRQNLECSLDLLPNIAYISLSLSMALKPFGTLAAFSVS